MKHPDARATLAPLLTLLLLAPSGLARESRPGAQDPPPTGEETVEIDVKSFRIAPELLERTANEAAAAVGEVMGVSLKDVPVRLATRKELAKVLEVELTPQFRMQFEDEEDAKTQCRTFVELYEQVLLAKLASEKGEILVCEENFGFLSRILERPGLLTPETLRAVLCHEMVHAADLRTFRWHEMLNSRDSVDALQAYSAVMEGHAQRIARTVCAKHGWSGAFEAFTETIGLSPTTGNAAIDYTTRILAKTTSFAYHDGERFIEAVERAGGQEAVRKAFTEPPMESALILEPGWYLDPSSRPALEFDLEAILSAYAEEWSDDDWLAQQIPLLRPQLEVSFSLLPKEKVDALLPHLRQCRVLVLNSKLHPPGTRSVMAGVFEFDTAIAATEFLVLEEDLLHIKDEQFTKGPVRIEEVIYEPVTEGPVRGLYSWKRIAAGLQKIEVFVLVAYRGRLVVELNFIGEKIDLDGLLAVAERLMKAGKPPKEKEKPQGEGEGSDEG